MKKHGPNKNPTCTTTKQVSEAIKQLKTNAIKSFFTKKNNKKTTKTMWATQKLNKNQQTVSEI